MVGWRAVKIFVVVSPQLVNQTWGQHNPLKNTASSVVAPLVLGSTRPLVYPTHIPPLASHQPGKNQSQTPTHACRDIPPPPLTRHHQPAKSRFCIFTAIAGYRQCSLLYAIKILICEKTAKMFVSGLSLKRTPCTETVPSAITRNSFGQERRRKNFSTGNTETTEANKLSQCQGGTATRLTRTAREGVGAAVRRGRRRGYHSTSRFHPTSNRVDFHFPSHTDENENRSMEGAKYAEANTDFQDCFLSKHCGRNKHSTQTAHLHSW